MPDRNDRSRFLQRYPDGTINFRQERIVLSRSGRLGRPSNMSKPRLTRITIGTFVERYRASDFFAHPNKPHLKETPLSAGTQYNYRLGLDLMHKLDLTSRSFADLTPNRANLYIKMVKREHGGAAAAQQKTLMSNLWKFARGFADFDGGDRLNPMKHGDIEQPYSVQQEHLPWPEAVQDDFLAKCDQNLYDAFHLLICTGQRVSDVVKMKREHYDGTHFELVQKKDRSKTPMRIKAPKVLRDVLAARAKRTGGQCRVPANPQMGSALRCAVVVPAYPRDAAPGTPTTQPMVCARTLASCWPRTGRRCLRSWLRSATGRRRWRCTTAAWRTRNCWRIRLQTSSTLPSASVPTGGLPRSRSAGQASKWFPERNLNGQPNK